MIIKISTPFIIHAFAQIETEPSFAQLESEMVWHRVNGEKMTFTYDFRWKRTLFALYTLLPHRDTISVAQIRAGALENAGLYSLNTIFQATISFIYSRMVKNK